MAGRRASGMIVEPFETTPQLSPPLFRTELYEVTASSCF